MSWFCGLNKPVIRLSVDICNDVSPSETFNYCSSENNIGANFSALD